MLPNLDFHHPTTWMVWLRTALSHTITSSITTGNYYRVKLKLCSIATNLSENFLIFRWDFFAGRPKNNHVLWVMIKMSLKQTRGGGCSFWWKGKLDSNDFDFVSDYCFIILKASKFQDWTVSPCFQNFSSVNPKRSWKTDVFQINPNPKMIPNWFFFIMGCDGLHITVDFPIS